MNIEEMNDREKSVMLAKLCGWEYTEDMLHLDGPYNHGVIFFDPDPIVDESPSLYETENMVLAWMVLNWACANFTDTDTRGFWCGNQIELREFILYSEFETMPPANAQCAWLDKILELAIKAGMVAND